jgi:sugar phosphate isomerase/epimerase
LFRIGTTSYIIPADILPNVEYLAPIVDDVELVLFETDEYGSNLPDATLCARLAELSTAHALTYTVHLPLDLRLGDGSAADGGDESHMSLRKARRVIEATQALEPYAYVLHLDGCALLEKTSPAGLAQWQANARRALEILCGWAGEPERVCVENIERWDPEAFAPVVTALGVGRTIDIGHLWLQGVDPLIHLARWIGRTRVIHLHGIGERDHQSLVHAPAAQLDPVVRFLAQHFDGVLTLEVFNQVDLQESLRVLHESLARVTGC